MAQLSLQATEKSEERVATRTTTRLFYLDHLRAALIVLVVLHHVAMVYAQAGPFYYVNPVTGAPLVGLALFIFPLFNQAWFMGALFLIAGYFTPGSLERRGSGSFIKERLLRLGLPLLVYLLVIDPLSAIGLFLPPAASITGPLTWQTFWRLYPEFIGIGPGWFLALLLIFSAGYVAANALAGKGSPTVQGVSSSINTRGLIIFTLALALASYLVRIFFPIGRELFGFPTLAYLPQYLSFFVIGSVAYRRGWLQTLADRLGKLGFLAAVLATLLFYPIIILGIVGGTFRFLGNGSWPSAVYALWDSIFAVGMALAAITFFRRYLGKKSKFGAFLAQQSYAVYVIHVPIVVLVAYLLRGMNLGLILMFSLTALIAVTLSFTAAWLMRKIPGVARVL